MLGDRYKVVLSRMVELVDTSKTGLERYEAKLGPGEYVAVLSKNPRVGNCSNWLVFEGTTLGATVEYIKSVALSVKVELEQGEDNGRK